MSTGPHGIAIDERTFPQTDGTQVVVVRFLNNHVDYSLHVGSQDPPTGQAVIGPDSGPAIGAAERPLFLACFNGGFKASSGAGGFEVYGQVLTPLANGLASLVIDTAGVGHVGVWGQDVPPAGISVTSVRQNLPPLLEGGQPSPQAGIVSAWGATLGGGAYVARSALGEDAFGNLLYAASMSTVPTDLAAALISAGAMRAMELDINPEWVQMDTRRPRGPRWWPRSLDRTAQPISASRAGPAILSPSSPSAECSPHQIDAASSGVCPETQLVYLRSRQAEFGFGAETPSPPWTDVWSCRSCSRSQRASPRHFWAKAVRQESSIPDADGSEVLDDPDQLVAAIPLALSKLQEVPRPRQDSSSFCGGARDSHAAPTPELQQTFIAQ